MAPLTPLVPLVSDEVWRQLDPYAGQLSRRTVRRIRLAIAVVVIVGLAAAAAWRSGAIVPKVSWPRHDGLSWDTNPRTHQITVSVKLRNDGWTAAEVVGAGRAGAGIELVEVSGAFPIALEPGAETEIAIVYKVSDCAAVPEGPWPMPVQIARPWGVYTAYVALPYVTSPEAPTGMRSWVGRDPYAGEWQQILADLVCDPR